MEEYSDIKTIEDLYNEEEISGKSYLFCVDNDIDTLQDLQKFIAETSLCENIPDDLLTFINIGHPIEAEVQNSSLSANTSDSIDVLQRIYELSTLNCSVRTRNCLDRIEFDNRYPSDDFFKYLLDPGLFLRVKQIKNAGRKTIDEITHIVENIKSNIIEDDISICSSKESIAIELGEENEDSLSALWFLINKHKCSLSVRCRNIVERLISENNNSLVQLYNYLSSPKFNSDNIKGIGKKTGDELRKFCNDLLLFVEGYLHNEDTNINDQIQIAKYEAIVALDESDIITINVLSNKLNRTPIFKLIDCVIKQDKRINIIISKSTRVYNGAEVNVDEVCDILDLTRERIRQLRNKFFSELIEKINIWMQHFEFSYYEQYCAASWDKNNIYLDEGVDFSDDFIDIVSSVLFKADYTLIGDMQECMMSLYDRKEALFIVPNDFVDAFDFKALLDDINQRVEGKIYEDYYLDLNHHILNYFKDIIKFDFVDSILEYIRLMLFEKFQLIADDGKVFFKKDSNKSILEYIEEILEEKSDIMSLDEIYEVLESRYPGLTKSKVALRGSIIRSDRVDAIGRSGKYALKEWSSKGIKTGTIKDLVYDYLLEFSIPQSLESIESYVLQYRPDTDANSIYNNLLLDKKGVFALLVLADDRYVAISTHSYGDEFVNVKECNSYPAKRSYQESFDVLYRFVVDNDRFPFTSSKNTEEERISRFLSIARAKRKKNILSEEKLLMLNKFESEFGDKEISKNQYDWNIRFSELENYILIYGKLPTISSNTSLYTWVNKQKGSISQGKLRVEDATKINNLLTQVL